MFEPRNRRELSNFAQTRSRSRREDFSSVRDPARLLSRPIHTPPQPPTPLKSQELCVQWRLLGPYPHMWSPYGDFGEGGEVTPPPIPSPPSSLPSSPPYFPPHPLAGVWCVCPCVWCTLSVARSQKNFRPVHLKSSANLRKSSANFQKHALYIKNQI